MWECSTPPSQEVPAGRTNGSLTDRRNPEQWNRALDRALADGLDVLTEPVSGAIFVESSIMPGMLYRVTPRGCSCKAGARGVPCKHRACLLAQMGILPLDPGPDPAVMERNILQGFAQARQAA